MMQFAVINVLVSVQQIFCHASVHQTNNLVKGRSRRSIDSDYIFSLFQNKMSQENFLPLEDLLVTDNLTGNFQKLVFFKFKVQNEKQV